MVKDPEFSASQVETIRIRLDDYRAQKGAPGRLLSCASVVKRIRNFEEETREHYSRKRRFDADDEAIRRFTRGTTLLPYRLDILKNFLIHEGSLTSEELEDDPDRAERLAVVGFLADGSERARHTLDKLAPVYRAELGGTKSSRSVLELHIRRAKGDSHFEVEERVLLDEVDEGPSVPRDFATNTTRFGYGFVATKSHVLHVYVKGWNARDRVHYMESKGFFGQRQLRLLQSGEGWVGSIGDPDAILRRLNILTFVPEEPETAVQLEEARPA